MDSVKTSIVDISNNLWNLAYHVLKILDLDLQVGDLSRVAPTHKAT